ncbi:hypothetical protein BDV95DRAFT_603134 [Massariosphaeria phaeospora]|uniref:Uncharacterized protein n=1 Tax=Massariosphaeria phaeospora TaxID=100035 RepID=A0A7C8ILH5_9PLEO|nr:hypothetical protein BDV95DRAFT_603134 [Massariosphaeria phaeospora]
MSVADRFHQRLDHPKQKGFLGPKRKPQEALPKPYPKKPNKASIKQDYIPHENFKSMSVSARKELLSGPTITMHSTDRATATQLGHHKDDTVFNFIGTDVSPVAVAHFMRYLKDVCIKKTYYELPPPDDIEFAAEISVAAASLGMDDYAKHVFDFA